MVMFSVHGLQQGFDGTLHIAVANINFGNSQLPCYGHTIQKVPLLVLLG